MECATGGHERFVAWRDGQGRCQYGGVERRDLGDGGREAQGRTGLYLGVALGVGGQDGGEDQDGGVLGGGGHFFAGCIEDDSRPSTRDSLQLTVKENEVRWGVERGQTD